MTGPVALSDLKETGLPKPSRALRSSGITSCESIAIKLIRRAAWTNSGYLVARAE